MTTEHTDVEQQGLHSDTKLWPWRQFTR